MSILLDIFQVKYEAIITFIEEKKKDIESFHALKSALLTLNPYAIIFTLSN